MYFITHSLNTMGSRSSKAQAKRWNLTNTQKERPNNLIYSIPQSCYPTTITYRELLLLNSIYKLFSICCWARTLLSELLRVSFAPTTRSTGEVKAKDATTSVAMIGCIIDTSLIVDDGKEPDYVIQHLMAPPHKSNPYSFLRTTRKTWFAIINIMYVN